MVALPGECVPPAFGAGGGHTRWEERGWGVNILEDARHRSVLYCTYVSTLWILYIFGGRIRSSEAAMDGGGAQRPVWGGNELKKTGARSARARTRGQNPLVYHIFI